MIKYHEIAGEKKKEQKSFDYNFEIKFKNKSVNFRLKKKNWSPKKKLNKIHQWKIREICASFSLCQANSNLSVSAKLSLNINKFHQAQKSEMKIR